MGLATGLDLEPPPQPARLLQDAGPAAGRRRHGARKPLCLRTEGLEQGYPAGIRAVVSPVQPPELIQVGESIDLLGSHAHPGLAAGCELYSHTIR